jgi:hypothetical protein
MTLPAIPEAAPPMAALLAPLRVGGDDEGDSGGGGFAAGAEAGSRAKIAYHKGLISKG